MRTALQVANQIIRIAKNGDGLVNTLSPLKMQKLLFYAQAWYAANTDNRLFKDDIYAWKHGPVVEDVYHELKEYGSQDLKVLITKLEAEDQEITDDLKTVLGVYGNMSAYELVARTHKEEVWRKNYESTNQLMPFEEIRKAFKLKLSLDS